MSFSKPLESIQGIIDGKSALSSETSKVFEVSPEHFIVISGNETTEIFLSAQGNLSDGNGIDGVEVTVESERERIINKHFAFEQTSSTAKVKGMILKAPMPGMVRAVSVKVGDKVQKNTQILVLEAMKMENSIMAGFAGIVSKIHVEAGVSVEKNMPLAEFSQG